MKKLDLRSMDIAKEQREKLRQLFPEVFTEDKIDFEKLKLTLGENVEVGKERYGMNWPGKADCFKIIQSPSIGTLKPCPEESVNFDTTENLFIEGDNLEVLKLLQKSYYGKIKMIYIDPPYNTGNDFIYPDDYKENLKTYLQYTGQIDAEGKKFSTNTDREGRFHSKWLNMMYPRLFLAKNLLADDGAIFISIDDNELANLKRLCDEIFGEENFINIISVKVRETAGESGGGEDKRLKKQLDYLLMYAKNKINYILPKVYRKTQLEYLIALKDSIGDNFVYSDVLVNISEKKYEKTIKDGEGNDIKIFSYGFFERKSVKQIAKEEGLSVTEVYKKYYKKIYTTYNARTSIRDRVKNAMHDFNGLIEIEYVPRSGKYKGKLTSKYFVGNTKRLVAWLSEVSEQSENGDIIIRNEIGTLWDDISWASLAKEGGISFENGKKPIEFIKRILALQEDKDYFVLDFFAGSGSTAHAVLDLNNFDQGKRKFICVQLPEKIFENEKVYKMGYRTVSELGIARIKNVIKDLEGLKIDLGFKVFKLDKSNFKIWDGENIPKDKKSLEKQLELHIDHIDPKATQEDILFEILLKSGFELTTKIEKIELAGKTVYSIEDGAMLVCLEKELTKKVIKAMAEKRPSRVICLDQGFANNDQLKTNAVQIMKTKGVDDFRTV